MKFMKLGSKPDFFQTDGDNIRYVATELATDVLVNVGDVKFYLHKFPLLSKSASLQKLVATTNENNNDEIHIHDIPGGPAAFEICAKFCYGMTFTLNAYNVVATRCAAEYLEMYETVEKGNLIYKVEVFLNSSIFRSWKDSIIVLQTTRSLLPWAEEIKVVSHCLDCIALKASIDTSKVEWSYTYNHKKLPPNDWNDPHWNGTIKQQVVPKDWWVEDLCGLQLDLYKRVITIIKAKGKISGDLIGEALKAYTTRRLSGFSKGMIQGGDVPKNRSLVETVIHLLPTCSVPCSFLLRLLKAALLLDCGEVEKCQVINKIVQQLEEATVSDLLIQTPAEEAMLYEVDIVQGLIEEFVAHDRRAQKDPSLETEFQEIRSPRFLSDTSKVKVAKLADGYLTEVSRDPNLPVSKFVGLAELVSSFSRATHDGLYRAIDMYLREHPGICKSERKKLCKLMDCRKLSADACMHAVQNERLPLRVVVQVLFFEQIRASASGGNSTPDLQGSIGALIPGGSHGSSRSTTTNTEEDWDAVPTAEEIKALKGELSNLRLVNGNGVGGTGNDRSGNPGATNTNTPEKASASKMKGMLMSKKIFSKLWSGKEKNGEISSSSNTSESPGSVSAEETKSNQSRSRRLSVS